MQNQQININNINSDVPLRRKVLSVFNLSLSKKKLESKMKAVIHKTIINNFYDDNCNIKEVSANSFVNSDEWINKEHSKNVFNSKYNEVFNDLYSEWQKDIEKKTIHKALKNNLNFTGFTFSPINKFIFSDEFLFVFISQLFKNQEGRKMDINQILNNDFQISVEREILNGFFSTHNREMQKNVGICRNNIKSCFDIISKTAHYFYSVPPLYDYINQHSTPVSI